MIHDSTSRSNFFNSWDDGCRDLVVPHLFISDNSGKWVVAFPHHGENMSAYAVKFRDKLNVARAKS